MSGQHEDTPSELERIALRLDDVCAWSEASKVLNHSGWVDVLETIKRLRPLAYQELVTWIEEGGHDAEL